MRPEYGEGGRRGLLGAVLLALEARDAEGGAPALGTVAGFGLDLADLLDDHRRIVDEVDHLLVGHLGDELLPVGIVVVLAVHVDELELGVGLAELVLGYVGGVSASGLVADGRGLLHQGVGIDQARGLLGEGALPVGAGQVDDKGVLLLDVLVLLGVDVVEDVGNLGADD